jgi:ABC-type dipeptide/oligopeptide/nickel transport system ATPase component
MSIRWDLMCSVLAANGKDPQLGMAEEVANTIVIMTVGKIVECRKFEKLTDRLEAESTPAKKLLEDSITARRAEAYAKTSWKKPGFPVKDSPSERHFANS